MQQELQQDKMALLQAGLERVKQEFIASVPGRVAALDGLLDDLYEEGDISGAVDGIGQHAHKLHGQAGSFGFADISATAARLEQEVMNFKDAPQADDTETIETCLVELLDQIDETFGGA